MVGVLDGRHGRRRDLLGVDDNGLLHGFLTLGGAIAPALPTQSILVYINFTSDFLPHAILATAACVPHYFSQLFIINIFFFKKSK